MRNCSPVPVIPPVPRFPRHARPRKPVITVNGLVPDANGNVDVGDLRREDFSGVETKEKMTLNEVGGKVNEVIGRLKGPVIAAVAAPLIAFGYAPETPLGTVHPDTTLREVVEAGGGGQPADAVREIVDSSFAGGTNAVNGAVAAVGSGSNSWNRAGSDATNYVDGVRRALVDAMPDGSARALPKYLHDANFADSYPEEAAEYYRSRGDGKADGGCSSVRSGGFLSRNFDYPFDDRAEFVVHMLSGPVRFASVGVAQVGTNITEAMATSGKPLPPRWYKALPGATVDGINEHGVVAEINVVGGDPQTSGWHTTGDIHPLAAVRWALDHATNAQHAATFLAANIRFPQGWTQNFHYMIADESETWIVEDGKALDWNRFVEVSINPVLTNFIVDGDLQGGGIERFILLVNGENITNAWYTRAYRRETTPPWVSDLREVLAYTNDIFNAWASHPKEYFRGKTTNGQPWWQTVHTSVYDLTNRTLRVAVQEQDDWYVFALPPGGKVKSVNGRTGEVVLDAEAVNALPDDKDKLVENDNFKEAVEEVSPPVELPENWALANVTNRHGEVAEDLVTLSVKSNALGSVAEGSTKPYLGTKNAHSEGNASVARGENSHAEGFAAQAIGRDSHAEGYATIATAPQSHAAGVSARANENGSWVWSGTGSTYNSHGAGTFNVNPNGGLSGVWVGGTNLDTVVGAKRSLGDLKVYSTAFTFGAWNVLDPAIMSVPSFEQGRSLPTWTLALPNGYSTPLRAPIAEVVAPQDALELVFEVMRGTETGAVVCVRSATPVPTDDMLMTTSQVANVRVKRVYDSQGEGYINGDGEVWGSGDIVTWTDSEEPTWVFEPVQGQKDVWKFQNTYLWYAELQQWFCISTDVHIPNPDHTGIVSKDAPTITFGGGRIVLNRHTEAGGIVKKDTLAKTGDLAGYVPTTRKINGQELTQDITIQGMPTNGLVWNATAGNVKTANGEKEIGAADVGALAMTNGQSRVVWNNGSLRFDFPQDTYAAGFRVGQLLLGEACTDGWINRFGYESANFDTVVEWPRGKFGVFAVEDWSSLRTMLADANSNTNADCECICMNIVSLIRTSPCFSSAVERIVSPMLSRPPRWYDSVQRCWYEASVLNGVMTLTVSEEQ